MTRAARYAYAFLACAYVLGLVYQVFVAGIGIGLGGISLTAIGLAAFAGSFLVGEGGFKLR